MRPDDTEPDDAAGLRRQAEEVVKEQPARSNGSLSHDEALALVHELQVHQIELELQNEELARTRREAEALRDRYADLYDFAPVGYFTLDAAGAVREANLAGAVQLGVDRESLVGAGFATFLHPDSRPGFAAFQARILAGGTTETCDVSFAARAGRGAWYAQLRGRADAAGAAVFLRLVVTDITERRLAEEILRESEAKYRTFFADDISGDFVSTPDGRILDCNPAFVRMFGYASVEEARASDITGTYEAPADRAALLDRLRRERRIEKDERFRRRRDGTMIHVVENILGEFDGADNLVRIKGYVVDDTQRYRAEQALAASEQRQAFLLEIGDCLSEITGVSEITAVTCELIGRHLGVSGVVYCEIDDAGECATVRVDWTDGTVTSAAGRFCMDDFGVGDLYRQGLIRRTEDITVGHDEGETVAHSALGIRASLGVPICRGGRLAAVLAVHSARPRSWTDEEVELVRDAGGRIWAAVERGRVSEALRESEERLRLAQESATIAIWDWDVRTGGLTYTPELLLIYGLEEDPITTYGEWRAHVHPDDIERVDAERMAALSRSERYNLEYRILRPSGEVRWIAAAGRGYHDASGDLVRVLGVNIDITERKTAELALARSAEKLQQSNEELQRFAYVASHDLQEPLRSIVSFSQLLERRYRGKLDQDADDYIGFIVEGGNRMQRLIEDLLQLSRVETTARPLVPTDAGEVVADALRLMETPIREAGATIEVGPMPVVMADAAQLAQVFVNLVGNALKYRRENVPPVVRISAERSGGFYRFAVEDNGIGIEAEYLDRIFVIFQRLHTRDEYEGTGIGLAVVKKIVERHGGRIRVESTPGEGSTFLFTLPAA